MLLLFVFQLFRINEANQLMQYDQCLTKGSDSTVIITHCNLKEYTEWRYFKVSPTGGSVPCYCEAKHHEQQGGSEDSSHFLSSNLPARCFQFKAALMHPSSCVLHVNLVLPHTIEFIFNTNIKNYTLFELSNSTVCSILKVQSIQRCFQSEVLHCDPAARLFIYLFIDRWCFGW